MFLRRYGTGTGADVDVPMIKRGVVDFAVSADWTPAAGDVKVSKDGGAAANIGTLPTAVAMGNGAYWKFVFSDAELSCKRLIVTVADSATKAVEDQAFIVETYGNASAMYPVDLSASVLPVNVTHFGGTAGTFVSGIPDVKTASIAADAVNAAALAANAVTEIQSGLATATNVSDAQTAIIAQIDANETKIDSIQSDTNDIQTRLPAALVGGKMDSTAVLDSAALRSALGMSAADLDSQLDAILAAASAGAGTGARTVTITVNDGTTALQNAVVRLNEGVNTFRALTNVSGVATFNLNDATYTVAITKSGYSYAGTTLVVDGTETRTYSMTQTSITPPDGPTKTVLTILCLDENGDADSGVNVSIRYVTVPTDSVDIAFPGASITKTSNGSGVATFQVIKGATIEYKRGTRDVWLEATMSDEDTTSITSFIGTP